MVRFNSHASCCWFIVGKKYNIIYLDPPWGVYKDKANAGQRGAGYKYPLMSLQDIKSLPINKIAADDCVLFLWATFPLLQEALDVIKAYGFVYKTVAFNFVKTNKIATNTLFWGMGNWTRSNSEICLLAVKGTPKRMAKNVHQVVMSPIEKHSKKPNEVKERIVKLMGDISRIELFSREITPGWACVGNDIDGKDINVALQEIINY